MLIVPGLTIIVFGSSVAFSPVMGGGGQIKARETVPHWGVSSRAELGTADPNLLTCRATADRKLMRRFLQLC